MTEETKAPTTDELAVLTDNDSVECKIGADIVTISPLTGKQLPPLLRLIGPWRTVIQEAVEKAVARIEGSDPVGRLLDASKSEAEAAFSPFDLLEKLDWLGLIGEHGEQVYEALAIATGRPLKFIEDLKLDDIVVLLQKVVEVNLDFFVRRLVPISIQALAELTTKIQALRSAGPTPTSA
jgi:hypothetical protein